MEQISTWLGSINDWQWNVAKENNQNISGKVFETGDILQLIFSNFGITDLKNMSMCNKLCKKISNDNSLWEKIRTRLDFPLHLSCINENCDPVPTNIDEKEGLKNFYLTLEIDLLHSILIQENP